MRRRLDLAASLVGRPSVIFLDEPTTGLDPAKREDMWDVVRSLVAEGSTVLLTTQYLDEADALADEIIVIDHGQGHRPRHPGRPEAGHRRAADRGPPDRSGPARRRRRPSWPRSPGPRAGGHRTQSASRCPSRANELLCRPWSARLAAGRHRRQRAFPAPAEPGRGLPDPDRPRHRPPTRRPQHDHHHPDPDAARGRPAVGAAARRPRPAAATFVRHVLALAKRSLIKTWRTPEALIDVTLQPIIFLVLFTYIFGGAIAGGSQHDYLQFLLPGMLGQTIAMAGVAIGQNLNADIEKGVFDRFRSLPIARSVPLVGAVSADVVRYLILVHGHPEPRLPAWASGSRPMRSRRSPRSPSSIAFALCFCWISVFVGMKVRTPGAVQGIMFLLVLPLQLRLQHLSSRRRPCRAGCSLRQRQPDQPPGLHRPRADARRTGRRPT